MTNLNGKQRCEHCFSEMKKNTPICSYCMGSNGSTDEYALKEGSVLMGKYVVGMFLFKDDLCNYYMGFDMERNSRVSIRELFVDGLMKRGDKGQTVSLTSFEDSDRCLFDAKKSDFYKDAQITASFKDCKNICLVRDLFDANNTSYSVCDFPENGITLRSYLEKFGRRPDEKQILKIMRGIIKSLETIHDMEYIHGNLRPENIIIDGADISLMWLHNSELGHSLHSAPMKIMNAFAPPEQYKKGNFIGPWTDIYSLGCVVAYMTTGTYPQDSLSRLMNGTDLQISGVSAKFNEILLKMTELSTNERYENLDALCVDLTESKVLRLKTSGKSVTKPEKKSHKGLIISIIAVLVICIGAAATWYFVFYKDSAPKKDKKKSTKSSETVSESDSDKSDDKDDDKDGDKGEDKDGDKGEDKAEDKSGDKDNSKNDDKDGDSDSKKAPDDEPEDGEKSEDDNKSSSGGFSSAQWYNNVMEIAENSGKSSAVFGNKNYDKEDILEIEFCDSTDDMSKRHWDISKDQDETVMAWVKNFKWGKQKGYKLYIGAEGGINAKGSLKSCFQGYENLKAIKFNGALHTEYTEDMSCMFKDCHALKKLDLSGFNTTMVSDMSNMFGNCESLEEIDFGDSFNTVTVTTMSRMFYCCSRLKSLDLSGFSTQSVTDLSYMFSSCSKLKSLDLSDFSTSKCTDLSYMFSSCSALESLDFGRAVVDPNANVDSMFKGCSKLKDLKTNSDVIEDAYKAK